MKLTWQQVETVLVAAYGKDGAEAVQQLRGMEGLLNQANQCGDVAHIIDHGLVAMDQGEVATRD